MTARLCVPAQCPGAHCSRVRDPGRRRKGEEPESAPRETLAQGAFQLCRLQRRPARTAEAPQRGWRTRPHPPEPGNSPGGRGRPAGLRPRRHPEAPERGVTWRAERCSRGPRRLGALLVAQPPESSEVRRQRKLEPGRPTPERGASSRPERASERGTSRPGGPPRPPSSAPDSRRLSRPRGGAADASHRLPAFSISPFAP